jgi:hypothetical protein
MIVTIPTMLPRPDKARQYAPDIYGNDIVTYRTTYTQKAEGMPQILLVEQPEPGSTLLPHYHASDQFQLFMDGGGKLGAHTVDPVSLHYTNHYTGYGPIVAGERGINYYVLRPSFDVLGPGQYLFRPELREKLRAHHGKKRTFISNGIQIRDLGELRKLAGGSTETLFRVKDGEADVGTLAEVVSLAPGESFTGPEPRDGGGQVHFVLQGSIETANQELGARSAIAVTKDESALVVRAGGDGVQLLLMQYPRWG